METILLPSTRWLEVCLLSILWVTCEVSQACFLCCLLMGAEAQEWGNRAALSCRTPGARALGSAGASPGLAGSLPGAPAPVLWAALALTSASCYRHSAGL